LKSHATCDSAVLPRSPTDLRTPPGQRRCRTHREHCYRLQVEAIRGLQSRSDRSDYHGSARTCQRRRRSRRKPAAACGTRAYRMHIIRNMQLAGSPAVANRLAEAALCLELRASTRTRVSHPNMPDLARTYCAHSRPIPRRDQRQLQVGWARLARAMRLAPTISRDLRGRMRGVGATCTAPVTHALSKHVPPQECRKIRAGRRQRLRISVITAKIHVRRGRWLGLALGYRQPWLSSCGIWSRHAVSDH